MSKIKVLLPEDITLEYSDPFDIPSEVHYEKTSADNLWDAIEVEKADREWQLSKFTDTEIADEYKKRFPF
jgi:hypothetical protein